MRFNKLVISHDEPFLQGLNGTVSGQSSGSNLRGKVTDDLKLPLPWQVWLYWICPGYCWHPPCIR
ncbi:MAG TPA: hypothetical protein VGE26_09260 [Sphingobacteriaceae bacterium]